MAQAYDAIIATIVVAADATSVTKTMVNSTTWREGTEGTWNSTDCTLTAGNTYQFRTPNSGFGGTSATLPNIKADVTIAWDTTSATVSTLGDNFCYNYAYQCSLLTSLGVPDTSGITSVGSNFARGYAAYCTSLTSLGCFDTSGMTSAGSFFLNQYAINCSSVTSLAVPDTSNITSNSLDYFMAYYAQRTSVSSLSAPNVSGMTSVGDYFMAYYANNCSSVTSLAVPNTSGLTSVGGNFMKGYAIACSYLGSLSVPDTSGITTIGTNFFDEYAKGCSRLTSLGVPDTSGISSANNSFMAKYASNCGWLTTLGIPDTSNMTSVGSYFLSRYVEYCTNLETLSIPDTSSITSAGSSFMQYFLLKVGKLTSLILPSSTGWLGTHNIDWYTESILLGSLYGYAPDAASQSDWQALTVSGKTLYTNYIQSADNVLIQEGGGTEASSERSVYFSGGLTDSEERSLYSVGGASNSYSWEVANDLESNDSDLTNSFSSQDYADVATDDGVYVCAEGSGTYFKVLFKEYNSNNTPEQFTVTWKGKSLIAPSDSTVTLQVYNRNSSTWENLDTDSLTGSEVEFTLSGSITENLSYYYDANYIISCRIYQ